MLLAVPSRAVIAADFGCFDILDLFKGTHVDVHRPESCKQCGHERCIDRCREDECVKGEAKLYKTCIHHEYVAVPEVRYKWEMKCITKEVPCDYCKTVCKDREVEHTYQVEHWQKVCDDGCCQTHCKSCECKCEKLECKECETKPGKTTVKVHYWSYVKVPYTVYRQVEKEVCVKQPYCEKVDVCVTRYVPCCEHCGGKGCPLCRRHDDSAGASAEGSVVSPLPPPCQQQ
jgi:hypothetical protein